MYGICIFYYSGFLSNLRLLWKTELPGNFSLYLNIFLAFRIFEQQALALKTEFALKFFKPVGGADPLDTPPRTPVSPIHLLCRKNMNAKQIYLIFYCWSFKKWYVNYFHFCGKKRRRLRFSSMKLANIFVCDFLQCLSFQVDLRLFTMTMT